LFRETCAKLATYQTIEKFEIFDNRNYEVSLSLGSRFFYGNLDEITKKDTINGLEYILNSPTNEYLVFFIQNLFDLSQNEGLGRLPFMLHRLRNRMTHRNQETENIELFDLLKQIIPRFQTLQIISNNDKSIKD